MVVSNKVCDCQNRSLSFGLKSGSAKVNMSCGIADITGDDLEFRSGYDTDGCNCDQALEVVNSVDYDSGSDSDSEVAPVKSNKTVKPVKANKKNDLKSLAEGVATEVIKNVAVSTLTNFFK